ncbi:MAG: hypothetical protein PHW24_04580 [Candidatus Moranbacteria bacterium]|nr:hypothetical protein [Candidatus Moranbacteria bacterium]
MEELLQPYILAFEQHQSVYVVFGIIITAVWLLLKDARRFEMKKLADDLSLSFKPYTFTWELFPIFSFIIKRFVQGEVLNFIEGNYKSKELVLFDFYYRKRLPFNETQFDHLVTFFNGKYFKGCSVQILKDAIRNEDFSRCQIAEDYNGYLRYKEVATVHLYANLKLKGVSCDLNTIKRVVNAFRSVNYKSALGHLEDALYIDKLNIPINELLPRIEDVLHQWNVTISSDDIEIIIKEYINILGIESGDDIIKKINFNK